MEHVHRGGKLSLPEEFGKTNLGRPLYAPTNVETHEKSEFTAFLNQLAQTLRGAGRFHIVFVRFVCKSARKVR